MVPCYKDIQLVNGLYRPHPLFWCCTLIRLVKSNTEILILNVLYLHPPSPLQSLYVVVLVRDVCKVSMVVDQ